MPSPLLLEAHRLAADVLSEGSVAIDATAGNGHDTLHLARCVGESGRVYAFDVQASALHETRKRLEAEGISVRVTMIQADHASMAQHVDKAHRGDVSSVIFNLGYLPGGDKTVTTQIESTLGALTAAWEMLRAGGVLLVVAYRGHPGGQEEADAVRAWFDACATEHEFIKSPVARDDAPLLFAATRS